MLLFVLVIVFLSKLMLLILHTKEQPLCHQIRRPGITMDWDQVMWAGEMYTGTMRGEELGGSKRDIVPVFWFSD